MSRKFLILGGIALLAVLAIVLWRGFGASEREGAITLYGNVDVREVDLAFLVPGRIEAIAVEEGAKVKAGDVLAQLDRRRYADAVSAAEGQLDVAGAALQKARTGSRAQEIRAAEAQLAEARAGLDMANKDLARRRPLVKTGAISQQAFDATSAQQRAAAARVEAASQQLSLTREGARAEDKAQAAAQVKSARAGVDSARTNLDDTALVAPSAGTVLTRAREPGAIVGAGETVLTLTIDNPVRIRAYVAETDLPRVAPGMKVRVSADGSDTSYAGTISQISPSAEFTPKTVQTEDLRTDLVYRVRILVTGAASALRQGQPVTVTLDTDVDK